MVQFHEPGALLPTDTANVKHRFFERMNRFGNGRDWVLAQLPDEGPLAGTKWYLHTRDAHDLYRRFGFAEPSERVLERGAGTTVVDEA